MANEDMEKELKELIVEALMLEETAPQDIDSKSPLFGDGLGLDSIDALELGVAISKRYGLQIDSNDPTIREAFASVQSLADFVAANRKG